MMSTLFDKVLRWTGVAAAPLVMAITVTTLSPTQAQAQGAAAANVIEVTGTVAVIDKENRTLTLIDGEGGARNISAPKDAENFDEIKKGDTMTIGYMESVEIFLAEPGTEPAVEATEAVERSEKGELPAGAVAQSVQASAKITAIDTKKRILTLVTEDGAEVQKEVASDIAAFDTLKVGDTIAVRISRMLAVEVDRPET